MLPSIRQTWTLSNKNLRIVVLRHWLATLVRALLLPVGFMIFLSFAKNLLVPNVNFGIGSPHPIRSLQWGMDNASGGRNLLVLINSGYAGGQIDQVIDTLANSVTGHTVLRQTGQDNLTTICRATLRGVTPCYSAIVFNSSPTEGNGSHWNYTIRADGSLGAANLDVTLDTNDAEVYLMPVQRAVDSAINALSSGTALPAVQEYQFTNLSELEKEAAIRQQFQRLLINFMSAVLLIAMIGVVYHLASFLSEEREAGLSTLIEAMMPNKQRWVPQSCRLISYWTSFVQVYFLGWLIGSAFFAYGIFPDTSKALIILSHLLAGCALTSWAILGAVFFKKAQLSGITVTIVSLVLGVIVQVLHDRTKQVAIPYILGILFAPATYVLFIITVARFEYSDAATNLVKYAPLSWRIYPILFLVFMAIQTFAYIALAAVVEKWIHGTESKGRMVLKGEGADARDPIVLTGFEKIYPVTYPQHVAGWFRKLMCWRKSSKPQAFAAVKGISFTAHRGQILCLLGANGAGKSTTLDAIAGLGSVTGGTIEVNGNGGIGICPQKNVLWPELTVAEHVKIWNHLKAPNNRDSKEVREDLIAKVDLDRKIDARAGTLSGGQKRKVQLAAMLTGGSAVCCVDEVSSGLDPLSRRKIWDILLNIRGKRTIIMTTHFLDESDVLADKICIMSKGMLKADGSSAELKTRHGNGYRITMPEPDNWSGIAVVGHIPSEVNFGLVTFFANDSRQVSQVIRALEKEGFSEYEVSEPTMDHVFLNLAEEIQAEQREELKAMPDIANAHSDEKHAGLAVTSVQPNRDLQLYAGRRITFWGQTKVLFRKRLILFRRNYFPYIAAFFIPIFTVALAVHGLVPDAVPPTCDPGSQTTVRRLKTIANRQFYNSVQGPPSAFNQTNGTIYISQLWTSQGFPLNLSSILLYPNNTIVNSYSAFTSRVSEFYKVTTPGAMWAGDANTTPTIAFMADTDIYNSIYAQNILNNELTGRNTITNFQSFNIAWTPDTGNGLQVIVYVCLAMSAFGAFFGLYTCLERIRGVRLLEYGNGARSLSRWSAYLAFDFVIVLVASAVSIGLMNALSHVWYGLGHLFVSFMLFGLCTVLLSYVISLYTSSQLATFAFVAGYLAVSFLVYLIAYLGALTYAPVNRIDETLLVVNYTMSLISPMCSLLRAMLISLNLFSSACNGFQFNTWPGHIRAYGGPILYLSVQSILLFIHLLWYDSNRNWFSLIFALLTRRTSRRGHGGGAIALDDLPSSDSASELEHMDASNDGLRVANVTKSYGSKRAGTRFTAVDNVSFGIARNEIYALLGPNGAGKSSVQALIRGDIALDRNCTGDIHVSQRSVRRDRAKAREFLGVCPQADCMDEMTVLEHLRHYARMRGLSHAEIEHNVHSVLVAVGLQSFAQTMGAKLSGGNKRRLMLGISILGNPTVLLLDEPSSGMDIVGQRNMWKALMAISTDRAILLTTHSMEESSALAGRAGIMAKRMLVQGTIDHLKRSYGAAHHVHLVSSTAPNSTDAEIEALRAWALETFPGAEVEDKSYHGQMRFKVPTSTTDPKNSRGSSRDSTSQTAGVTKLAKTSVDEISPASSITSGNTSGTASRSSQKQPITSSLAVDVQSADRSIGSIIALIEENKEVLGIAAFSVSPTTLDNVFLNIARGYHVQEEGYRIRGGEGGMETGKRRWWRFGL